MFNKFRLSILNCSKCRFKDPNAKPIYFEFDNPDNVKVLILTEQPNITQEEIEKAVRDELKSDMICFLKKLFNNCLKDLIINHTGMIYWTHQTKCYSLKGEIKPECGNKWILKEIEMFKKLKVILVLGAKAFNALPDVTQLSFADYLWKEINMITKNDINTIQLQFDINGKNIFYYCLPHPSRKSPLNIFNKHFVNYFNSLAIVKEVLKI